MVRTNATPNARDALRENITAFHKLEEMLKAEHPGKHALLHKGELVGAYATKDEARKAALAFQPGEFAISPRIGAPPESLGAGALYVLSAPV